MITSASCSIAPDSRRSELIGRLFGRCSRERLSWDSATTGTLNSLASALSEREISEISLVRFSEEAPPMRIRSEEHTSELQSRENLVCRLLLEKKKKQNR